MNTYRTNQNDLARPKGKRNKQQRKQSRHVRSQKYDETSRIQQRIYVRVCRIHGQKKQRRNVSKRVYLSGPIVHLVEKGEAVIGGRKPGDAIWLHLVATRHQTGERRKDRTDRTAVQVSTRDGIAYDGRGSEYGTNQGGRVRRRRRRRTGVREGVVASLAVVVFRGMLGGRFPRGLCYRLGRMTSPRYQILNLLAPAAYPRQGIQTFPPTRSLREPRVHGSPLARHRCLPSKPTPSRFTAASRSLPVLLADA